MNPQVEQASALFRMADPVPPDAYEHAASGKDASATLRRILHTPQPPKHKLRNRRLLAAVIAVPTAAAAVALGGIFTNQETPAYAVTSNSDGTVSITFDSALKNNLEILTHPDRLQHAIAKHGVPNRVLVARPQCPPGTGGQERWHSLPAGAVTRGNARWIVHRDRIPRGWALLIGLRDQTANGSGRAIVLFMAVSNDPPTCLLNTQLPPAHSLVALMGTVAP
ncbi:hypothetical protein GCM10029978_107820 [Actinoallomurus acanthiterrae]